jgi:SAM-dependent methyltransferase
MAPAGVREHLKKMGRRTGLARALLAGDAPLLGKLRRSIARRGLAGTVAAAGTHARYLAHVGRERVWDWRHGTETAQKVEPAHFETASPSLSHAQAYEAITDRSFGRMIRALPLGRGPGRLPLDRCTFIDLGSGKGKALFLASRLPFRQLIGLELSPRLHRIAERNARRFCRGAADGRFCLRCGDAASFRFPPDPTVLFLYNPFQAPVMARVLENIAASLRERPRRFFAIYRNPLLADLFDGSAIFQVLEATPDFRIYAAV